MFSSKLLTSVTEITTAVESGQTTVPTTATDAVSTALTTDGANTAVDKIAGDISRIEKFFNELLDNTLRLLPTIILAIVVLIVGMVLSKLLLKAMQKGMSRRKVEITVVNFAQSLGKIVLYLLVFCVVLSILGIPMTSIVAVIGTAGIAIGLALQNSLSNLAGGFIILFSKPFKSGDFIETNGASGTVDRISILYTQLNTPDNKAIFVPNGLVLNAKVTNFTAHGTRRVDNAFSISYNDDYDHAVEIIQSVISKNAKILKTPEPFVRMSEHGQNSINIESRVWTDTADYWEVYFYMIEYVRKAFVDNNIEIPFNQLDVHISKE